MTTRNNPLTGVCVVNTGLNLPGPAAAQLLAAQGARVIKIEPPSGDTFRLFCQPWYEALHENVERWTLDLKSEAGRAEMHARLAQAQILITSQRPAALVRMGLDGESLRQRYPRLAIVHIIGSPAAEAHLPGHDLTYQAQAGLVAPPQMPRTLMADLAGAQQAALTALALLAAGGGVQEVALSQAVAIYHLPLAYGLTRSEGLLGGGHAGYRLYAAADGWLALAALEGHFWQRLHPHVPDLPVSPFDPDAQACLAAVFRTRTAAAWVAWAREYDIPLEQVIE